MAPGHHHLFHSHPNKDDQLEAPPVDHHKEMKHHKHLGHLAKTGVVVAGVYATHEKHKAKKEPEHAHKHKVREEVAVTAAVGAAGFALHEHHKAKHQKHLLKKEKPHALHHH